jgi:hypothetical protein
MGAWTAVTQDKNRRTSISKEDQVTFVLLSDLVPCKNLYFLWFKWQEYIHKTFINLGLFLISLSGSNVILRLYRILILIRNSLWEECR